MAMRQDPIGLVIGLAFLLFFLASASSQYIYLSAGHITLAELRMEMNTSRWGGIVGQATTYGEDSPNPFGSIHIFEGTISAVGFPGINLRNGKYYYVAIPYNVTINLSNIENVSDLDLEANQLFSQSQFPQFYPDYYKYADNPKKTFCSNGTCQKKNITVGGEWFQAMWVRLNYSIDLYLLKYKVNPSLETPMFLVKINNYTGYDGNPANFEMILPSNKDYYMYIMSSEPAYNLTVWIDGVRTLNFQQTALPYNLTVLVTNLYTGKKLPNINVVAFEENGNDIFIPKRLSGLLARSLAVGKTDSNGLVSFIVAPTEYPLIDNYSIAVGVLIEDGSIARRKNLAINNYLSLVQQKKPLEPSNLADNAKVAVNAMNQLVSSLYKWANDEKRAYAYNLVYFANNGSYYFLNLSDYNRYSSATVRTGAPNVFLVTLKDSSGASIPGYVSPLEEEGYLIMNPTYKPPVVGNKTHLHDLVLVPTMTNFIIVPTSYGTIDSTITMRIYDQFKQPIGNVTLQVDKSLEPRTGGITFTDDEMKTTINAMNQILYSLYYALN